MSYPLIYLWFCVGQLRIKVVMSEWPCTTIDVVRLIFEGRLCFAFSTAINHNLS